MEDFVSFEIAKKLKEKGFPQSPDYFNYSSYYDWDGLRKIHSLSNASVWFDPNISRDNIYFAPTIEQVMKWLRHNEVFIDVRFNRFYKRFKVYVYGMSENSCDMHEDNFFNTYEDAAIAGIEYSLDNLI